MSAFPESSRSERRILTFLSGRFRPKAAVDAYTIGRIWMPDTDPNGTRGCKSRGLRTPSVALIAIRQSRPPVFQPDPNDPGLADPKVGRLDILCWGAGRTNNTT